MDQIGSLDRSARTDWVDTLSPDDVAFLKRFVLASGSLKAVATEYSVSYPTVRSRLDRLIAKIQAVDAADIRDPFERRLRALVADMRLSPAVAGELLQAHWQVDRSTSGSREVLDDG